MRLRTTMLVLAMVIASVPVLGVAASASSGSAVQQVQQVALIDVEIDLGSIEADIHIDGDIDVNLDVGGLLTADINL